MTVKLVQTIYWGEIASGTTYLYGSKISLLGKSVRFENLNFPSGKPMKHWRSRTNYQVDRMAPELPLLIPGQKYRFVTNANSFPENRFYFQVDFNNRQGERIAHAIVKGGEGTFIYPSAAFTYSITLYGAGCESLNFRSFSIFEEGETLHFPLVLPNEKARRLEEIPAELKLVGNLL